MIESGASQTAGDGSHSAGNNAPMHVDADCGSQADVNHATSPYNLALEEMPIQGTASTVVVRNEMPVPREAGNVIVATEPNIGLGVQEAAGLNNGMMVSVPTASGMTPQEAVAYGRLKAFCSHIMKKLAPPILKEIQASSLRPEAEPFTPKRTTRAAKRTATLGSSTATPAENVLLRMLGLVLEDLQVDDSAVQELKTLFDSPLREQHVRVIAALFGKALPGQTLGAGGSERIGVH